MSGGDVTFFRATRVTSGEEKSIANNVEMDSESEPDVFDAMSPAVEGGWSLCPSLTVPTC